MSQNVCSLILAGGFGTRLSTLGYDVPKTLIPCGEKSCLENTINHCLDHSIKNIRILAGYQGSKIRDYCQGFNECNIVVDIEEEPQGTANAVINGMHKVLQESSCDLVMLIYGDVYFDLDLSYYLEEHVKSGASISVLTRASDHMSDSDLVEVNNQMRIVNLSPYPHDDLKNLGNNACCGLYILDKILFKDINSSRFIGKDFAQDLLSELIKEGHLIKSIKTFEYIKDMGTPSRLDNVKTDILNLKPTKMSARSKRKVVFWDRDGTLIDFVPYLNLPSQVAIKNGIPAVLRELRKNDYLSICITNQPVIARGELSYEELNRIHATLEISLAEYDAMLDAILYCPHHPDSGFEGEVSELKVHCNCRKPNTGLFEFASRGLNLDYENSWMVGDSITDVTAGYNFGIKSILLSDGKQSPMSKSKDGSLIVNDVKEISNIIIKNNGLKSC